MTDFYVDNSITTTYIKLKKDDRYIEAILDLIVPDAFKPYLSHKFWVHIQFNCRIRLFL